MKIAEKIFEQDGKIVHQRTNDYTGEIEQVKRIREADLGVHGDNKLVGRIPAALIYDWCKEAGVKMEDTHAVGEIIKKKMLSGEFDAFRVWKGRY